MVNSQWFFLKVEERLSAVGSTFFEAEKQQRHQEHHHQDKYLAKTVERLHKFQERSIIVRDISERAVEEFQDGSLDFIYVDASHRFSAVALDLILWWPKLKEGGLLAGHDYWHRYRVEVIEAVNGFVTEHKQILHLTTEGQTAKGEDKCPPTWWFIKQDRTKDEWLNEKASAGRNLLAAKIKLANKGIEITLPREYLSVD